MKDFLELAEKFKMVAQIEDVHEKRFSRLENNILNGEVFIRLKMLYGSVGFVDI